MAHLRESLSFQSTPDAELSGVRVIYVLLSRFSEISSVLRIHEFLYLFSHLGHGHIIMVSSISVPVQKLLPPNPLDQLSGCSPVGYPR